MLEPQVHAAAWELGGGPLRPLLEHLQPEHLQLEHLQLGLSRGVGPVSGFPAACRATAGCSRGRGRCVALVQAAGPGRI